MTEPRHTPLRSARNRPPASEIIGDLDLRIQTEVPRGDYTKAQAWRPLSTQGRQGAKKPKVLFSSEFLRPGVFASLRFVRWVGALHSGVPSVLPTVSLGAWEETFGSSAKREFGTLQPAVPR